MEKIIFHISKVLDKFGAKILRIHDCSISFSKENMEYYCFQNTPITLICFIDLLQSYDKPQWHSEKYEQCLLKEVNNLNSLGGSFYFFLDHGTLQHVRFAVMHRENGNPSTFAYNLVRRLIDDAIALKKHFMSHQEIGESLGQYSYLGITEPLQRIAKDSRWTDVGQYSEGLVAVASREGLYGYLNADTQIVIPCRWTDAQPFSEGLAAVADQQGLYGFIDHEGKIIIPCEWHRADWFSEGLAAVMGGDGEWGFINNTGRLVIPCEWNEVEWFEHGNAHVYDAEHREYIIDREGQIISSAI